MCDITLVQAWDAQHESVTDNQVVAQYEAVKLEPSEVKVGKKGTWSAFASCTGLLPFPRLHTSLQSYPNC